MTNFPSLLQKKKTGQDFKDEYGDMNQHKLESECEPNDACSFKG